MLRRIDENIIEIDQEAGMRIPGRILAREGIEVEGESVRQLKDACSLPGAVEVWGMPDIHLGYGVPIGCVLGLDGYVVPAAAGYDINCGMRLLTTPLPIKDVNVRQIADRAHYFIPLGEGKRNVELSHDDFTRVLSRGVAGLFEVSHRGHPVWEYWNDNEEREVLLRIESQGSLPCEPRHVSSRAFTRGVTQLGTLGGGNHFIELQEVQRVYDRALAERFGMFEGQFVMMIHSGSRGFGHQNGDDYMKLARRYDDSHGGGQPNNQLCFLPADSEEGKAYFSAMNCSANFAFANRELMAVLLKASAREVLGNLVISTVYDVAHNIIKLEEHRGKKLYVHRKGATRAFGPSRMAGTPFADTGQPILTPGSMGTASYFMLGRDGSELTLASVNHGAGRVMSRTEARGKKSREAAISDEEFSRTMKGVYLICEDWRSAKEEAPGAYKNIDLVIETVAKAGLAQPVARMIPKAVLKG